MKICHLGVRSCELRGKFMKKSKTKTETKLLQKTALYFLTAAIPALLLLSGAQAKRFARVEKEIKALEDKQLELVENNKRMVTGISILANPERIEFLAVETLGMRQADSDEIVRVQMKEKKIAQ